MTDAVKKFIEKNIDLIEADRWKEVYKNAQQCLTSWDIGRFTSSMLEVDIHPEKFLEELPENFLYRSKTIETFSIPDNIKKINSFTFCGCESIANISIPNNVDYIGWYAFDSCKSLTSVTIPDSVNYVGNCAFQKCTSLTNVSIPNTFTSINYGMFDRCSSLASINIPNSITSFARFAFNECGDSLIIEYSGTKDDWKKIYDKDAFINTYFTVNCIDGKIVKKKR